MYLLDTNVVSELRKNRPHGAVLQWLGEVDEVDLHLSAVTLGEIQKGIEITRDQDPSKAADIESWLEMLTRSFNVVPMDGGAFRLWAKLMHTTSDALYEDAMLAATALVHRLTVVTRNVADFRSFGVEVLDPFKTPRRWRRGAGSGLNTRSLGFFAAQFALSKRRRLRWLEPRLYSALVFGWLIT